MLRVLHYPTTALFCLPLCPIRLLLPICSLCLLSRCPHPLQIQSFLIPPPLGHPWLWPPLRHQTQIHNGPGHNKLRDYVMEEGGIGLHLLQSRLCHCVLQKGIYPYSVHSSTRLPPYHPACHPVVESAQNPPNTGGRDPRLRPLNHDQLNHHQLYLYQGPGIRALPDQHLSQPIPLLPFYLKVADHLWTVIVRRQENSP